MCIMSREQILTLTVLAKQKKTLAIVQALLVLVPDYVHQMFTV